MDNYPKHLAPEFEDSGAVKTPFEEWWHYAKAEFQNVPEVIAKEWLHRHWGYSPFSWIPSKSYSFSMEQLPSNDLCNVLNGMFDFESENRNTLEHGKYLCGDHPDRRWGSAPTWLASYMRENRDFPSPIVVLENRDDHLKKVTEVPEYHRSLPRSQILVEGHLRHSIGLYLHSIKELKAAVSICRLRHI